MDLLLSCGSDRSDGVVTSSHLCERVHGTIVFEPYHADSTLFDFLKTLKMALYIFDSRLVELTVQEVSPLGGRRRYCIQKRRCV